MGVSELFAPTLSEGSGEETITHFVGIPAHIQAAGCSFSSHFSLLPFATTLKAFSPLAVKTTTPETFTPLSYLI